MVFFRSPSWVLSRKKVYFRFALNALADQEGRRRSLQLSKSISFKSTVKSLYCEEFITTYFVNKKDTCSYVNLNKFNL